MAIFPSDLWPPTSSYFPPSFVFFCSIPTPFSCKFVPFVGKCPSIPITNLKFSPCSSVILPSTLTSVLRPPTSSRLPSQSPISAPPLVIGAWSLIICPSSPSRSLLTSASCLLYSSPAPPLRAFALTPSTKRSRLFFQTLEKSSVSFPRVGKNRPYFPNPWKNRGQVFQALEKSRSGKRSCL